MSVSWIGKTLLMSRLRRTLSRKDGQFRDTRLFVIASEGKETERAYFEALEAGQKRIRFQVLAADERNLSAPKHVVARVVVYLEENDINSDDEVWLVLDTDRWSTSQLREVEQICKENGWNLAISNPCFEIWLYLHYADLPKEAPTNSKDWKKLVRQVAPGPFKSAELIGQINQAIVRAEALDTDPNNAVTGALQTNLYRLGKAIQPFLQDA